MPFVPGLRMTADNLSQRISELSQRLKYLQVECVSDPANMPKLLSDALESLQASIRDLSAAEKALKDGERKVAEEMLSPSAEQLKFIIDNSSDVAYRRDLRTDRYDYLSPAIEEITGFTMDEMYAFRTDDMTARVHPDDLNVVPIKFKNLKERKSVIEYRFKCKDGKYRWLSDSFRILADSHGMPLYRIGVVRNIDEHKRAEGALRKSEERYRVLVENSDDFIYIIGRDDLVEYVNNSAARSLGLLPEEIIGKPRSSFFSHEVADIQKRELNKAFETANAIHDENLVSFGNEQAWQDTHLIPLKTDANEVYAVLGISRDITERKWTEKALKESEERLRCLAQATFEGIVFSENGRVIEANEQYALMHGYKLSEMIGKQIKDLLIPEDFEIVAQLLRSGEEKIGEYHAVRKDGSVFAIETHGRTIKLGDKQVRVATIRDVTIGKHMEKELRRSKDELEQRVAERTLWLQRANEALHYEMMKHKETEAELLKAKEAADAAVEAKAEFLANMSHEIRTPLNAIIGLTGILLNMDPRPDHKDYIETIRSSGDTLLAVINDILDFSKIDSGKMKLEYQPFDLISCTEESVDLVAHKAKEKGLSLSFRMDDSVPRTIIGDPTRFRQILINLLSNAVKFTEQGSIEVFATSKALDDGKCSLHIAVKDTGIGIPPDRMNKIFQSFSQADMSTTRRYGGTGLGLVISKRLVEVMGGEIGVESVEGIGSTFHFTLPVDIYSGYLPKPKETPPRRKSEGDANMRILLAEDNAVNQMVMLHMLKYLGYRADVAADGVEVLKAMELQSYDLVLMDIQMPEMDGFETAKEIRRRWPGGPMIVALTAYALEGDREKCLGAGMDDYISKPVKLNELANILASVSL